MTRLLALIIFLFPLVGCKIKDSVATSPDGRISPTFQGPSELSYCSQVTSYSNAITVTGLAYFIRRNPWGDSVTGGLGSASTSGTHPATAHPIRRAEIRVTNSSGQVVQCGETGANGEINLSLPRGNVSYVISVNSRSNNSSYLRASVLNMPERNQVYSLQATVSASASIDIGTITASADGSVLGGAFNILDQFFEANSYLRSQVANFTSAPKVVAYWEPGYNPNAYFGGSSGLSFYLPGYSRLFILGGQDGDLNNSDTDHFDNSVVLHEYGHFLEDALFASDSPGGSHNGNRIIDPRLAWSEGWGNFFQAAVLYGANSTPYYIDTIGNDDGSLTEQIFHTNLETPPMSGGDCYPTSQNSINGDCPRVLGEGNFREFSVTRMLWDMIDSVNDSRFSSSENLDGKFNELWGTLVNTSNGFKDSKFAFRSVGHFHLAHAFNYSSTDMTGVRGVERHRGNTTDYAEYVTATDSCSDFSMTPAGSSDGVVGDTGTLATSDLLRNNDFYHFVSTGSGTITLEYEDANSSGTIADLDLYIYNESARLGVVSDMRGYSQDEPGANPSQTNVETVTSVPAGKHLINVNVYTGGSLGGTANYRLKFNGVKLCPTTLVQ